ncbi:YraN family protein, partial [Candidatus Woesebacteria bacterium]|nr:YraN family protein [Candidatus Woesebacteria bacterium]
EIDLIAHKRKTIIFVEVKLRRQTPKKGRDLEQLLPSSKKKALSPLRFTKLSRIFLF